MRILFLVGCLLFAIASPSFAADPPSAKEALQPFNLLIGTWKGTGIPEGTTQEREKGTWVEKIAWEWQFSKNNDAWLVVALTEGKHHRRGTLKYLPTSNQFQLVLETADKQSHTYVGALKEKYLTLERIDEKTKETHRLVFSLLHHNRFLYRYEVKAPDKTFFVKQYQVGATKDGVPFVEVGASERECVVSGGYGTTPVMHNGKTYYVCCSGCRDVFKDDPEKFIKEFEAKRKKNAKDPK